MPKLREVRRYILRNGWVHDHNSKHEYYKKRLDDGRCLYLKISFGDGEIPPRVFKEMLKQMEITQEEFNAGL